MIVRFSIAFVFIYAGAEKISDPDAFAISISNYRILPDWSLNIFAITLPWIEVTCGILLLFGVAVKENSAIIFSLLFIFTIAIVISLIRGLSIDCGCFGKGSMIGLTKLAENLLMLIGSLSLIAFDSKILSLESKN